MYPAGGYLRDLTANARRGEFSLAPMLMALMRLNGGVGRKTASRARSWREGRGRQTQPNSWPLTLAMGSRSVTAPVGLLRLDIQKDLSLLSSNVIHPIKVRQNEMIKGSRYGDGYRDMVSCKKRLASSGPTTAVKVCSQPRWSGLGCTV